MKNRGMYLESIINKTILLYKENQKGVFHKKDIPISFRKVIKTKGRNQIQDAYIKNKSTTDYYGCWNGHFVAFEAKSTNTDLLPLNNLKDHQQHYLKTIIKNNGIAFYIICFKKYNRFFIVKPDIFDGLDRKSLTLDQVLKKGFEMDFIYPGIIDFIPFLNKVKKNR